MQGYDDAHGKWFRKSKGRHIFWYIASGQGFITGFQLYYENPLVNLLLTGQFRELIFGSIFSKVFSCGMFVAYAEVGSEEYKYL